MICGPKRELAKGKHQRTVSKGYTPVSGTCDIVDFSSC